MEEVPRGGSVRSHTQLSPDLGPPFVANLTASPDAATKRRTARACSSCSRQKLKCDGVTPCARCTISKTACEYLPSLRGKRKRRTSEDHVAPGTSTPLETTYSTLINEDDPHYRSWKAGITLSKHPASNTTLWGDSDVASSSQSPLPTGTKRDLFRKSLTTFPLPGDAHNPLGILAAASATANVSGSPEDHAIRHQQDSSEDPRDSYYTPIEICQNDEAPHVMRYLKVHEAEQLFALYYKHLHQYLPFLDRRHSSAGAVARRNNFLFNAICCVSARAFNVVLWERLREFACFEMERLPKAKNIEVQAGLQADRCLNRPKHFESDMTWLRVGLAVRTALDINLHRVALLPSARSGLPTWHIRSIVRTWLLACIMDRTLSAQLGKPASIRGEGSVTLYAKLLQTLPAGIEDRAEDLWLAALAEWTQILSRSIDTFRSELSRPPSPNAFSISPSNAMFSDLVHVFSQQFVEWRHSVVSSVEACGVVQEIQEFLCAYLKMYEGYARLVVQSFGLERAKKETRDGRRSGLSVSLAEYTSSAINLISSICPASASELPKGTPDLAYTVLTYAVASLLRVLDKQYSELESNRSVIIKLTRSTADVLARSAVSRDHLPASQSLFLSRLIDLKDAEAGHTTEAVRSDGPEQRFDFEAFSQSLDNDASRALWPPVSASAAINQLDSSIIEGTSTEFAAFSGVQPSDLSAWISQNGFAVPDAALGGGDHTVFGRDDVMWDQVAFWKTITDGTPGMM